MNKSFAQPIFWHQGLFLQPHHLQHQDLSHRQQHQQTLGLLSSWTWGVEALSVRESALEHEQLVIESLRVLWPDGTLTDISSNAIIGSLNFKLSELGSGARTVYVGLRHLQDNKNNVGIYESLPEANQADFRHVITAEPQNIEDYYSGGSEAQASFMSYVLRLFWEDEIDELSSYDLIPLLKLEQEGDVAKLNSQFIPPCLSLSSAPALQENLHNLHDGLVGRARQLEIFKQPMGSGTHGTSSEQVYSILALSVLNRFNIELDILLNQSNTPPWVIHETLRRLVAELSTFSEYCNYEGENREGEKLLVAYRHQDITASFAGLFPLIGRLLNDLTIGPEMLAHFERKPGTDDLFVVDLPMEFFGARHEYYLIIRNNAPEPDFIHKIERESKLDEEQYIDDLIKKYLPGLPLQHMAKLPPGLPRRPGAEYFRISAEPREWNSLIRRRDIALFVPNAASDLLVDMIVLKR